MSKVTDTLMSPPMARAYAEGLKRRTRRVIKSRPKTVSWNSVVLDGHGGWVDEHRYPVRCRYGAPGDRLRLLTTWAVAKEYDHLKPTELPDYVYIWSYFETEKKPDAYGKLRPGRFLPKKFRHLMPCPAIIDIRPRELQDISEDEAREEGIREVTKDGSLKKYCVYDRGDWSSTPWQDMPRTAVDAFRALWDSINAKRGYPWDANDWVWDIEFEGCDVTL